MNDQSVITEVRSKVDIVDVIGEKLPLIQKGKNFFGVCPFHDDTNPSMSVSREKQIYTCFSCHATGNVFQFVMDYEHVDFKEALEILAKRANVPLKNISIKKETNRYDELYEIYRLTGKYYQNNMNTNYGKKAKDYLAKRKIGEDVIKEFEIGLSLPSMNDLTSLLTKKNHSLVTLNQIGLANDNNDAFIDRIMFPLYDISGKIIGFSGRIYENNGLNKYLNTKETPIFKKGLTLYHYHIAKEITRVKKQVIIMEGFMDVIRASTIGIKNTVALMGTAMTNEQANLIKRLSPNVVLCLDGDGPGKKATLAIGNHLLEIGIEPKVIALDNDYDPDTFILEFGKERFEALLESAIHFNDYKIKALKEGINFQSDEEKAKYINQVLEETSKLDDEIRIEIILKNLAKEFDIGYNTLEKRFWELKNKKPQKEIVIVTKPLSKKIDKYQKAMYALLYYMLSHSFVIDQYEKESIYLPDEKCRHLASEISYYYRKYGSITIADFYTYLQDKKELLTLLNSILEEDFIEEVTPNTIFDYFKVLKEYNLNLEVRRLKSLMEKEVDPLEQAKIADRIRMLRMGKNGEIRS